MLSFRGTLRAEESLFSRIMERREIPRFARNDTCAHFFRSLLGSRRFVPDATANRQGGVLRERGLAEGAATEIEIRVACRDYSLRVLAIVAESRALPLLLRLGIAGHYDP
jgi:hypothetical protein